MSSGSSFRARQSLLRTRYGGIQSGFLDIGFRRYDEFAASRGEWTRRDSDFDLYQKSLHRMANYHVEVVLLEHYGAAVGEEAMTLFAKAIQTAEDTRSAVENSYRLTGDVTKTTEESTRFVLVRSPDYFLDKEIMTIVIGQMVKFIIKAQEEKERSWKSS